MALEMKPSLKLSHQLVMTPQLQQAIKLLQMNRLELQQTITQEVMENPILEEVSEEIEGDIDVETKNEPEQEIQVENPLQGQDDFNWENYLEDFNSGHTASSIRETGNEPPTFENILTKTTSLEEHLRWQLSMNTFSGKELEFGELIIGNLNDDGYLVTSLEDLAQEAHLQFEEAERILKTIQHFDPLGVASRNLKECLLIQAEFLHPPQPLVFEIIENHLSLLEKKNTSAIAKVLSVDVTLVKEAMKMILEFEPKPGRSFESSETQYILPDIYVYKICNEFVIVLNEDGIPKLRISPFYRNLLQAARTEKNKKNQEYFQEKFKSAIWLIRSIHNRQKTIYKVTEAILKRQIEFFELGISYLKPMVLKDVAADVGMHESTISRVTTNKYVHTPAGIFELKFFFNSSIQASDGGASFANETVKGLVKQLIAKENPLSPLSDQSIMELLEQQNNIKIARRTVAKYRELLGIHASSKRKKYK